MNKITREELLQKAKEHDLKAQEEFKEMYEKVKRSELFDEDGYPTEESLELVSKWHWSDSKGWFEFIKSIWYMASFGWTEGDEENPWEKDKMIHKYYLSTAGWSGNELIVSAMQKNDMLWHIHWYQSTRGGHYIFEIKQED